MGRDGKSVVSSALNRGPLGVGNLRDLVAVPSEARPGWSWWLGSWKVEAWEGGKGSAAAGQASGK